MKELAKCTVGVACVAVVNGSEIDGFNCVGELFLESCFNVLVSVPLAHVFGVFVDDACGGMGCCIWRYNRVDAGMFRDGPRGGQDCVVDSIG